MRLIDIDELRGCAIIRPMSREEMGYILSCSNILIHDEIPTAYDKENDKEIRDKAIEEFAEEAMKQFTEFDLKHGYPTVTDCKMILREIAEQMKNQ